MDIDYSASSDSVLLVEKQLQANAESSQEAFNFLKRLWCCESPIDVSVSVTYSSEDDDLCYTICIAYKDTHYQCQKTFLEIQEFYNKMKNIFRGIPLPELILEKSSIKDPDDRTFPEKLEPCLKNILNDADFFCSELYKFFGCKIMEYFPYIYQLNQSHIKGGQSVNTIQHLLCFTLSANVIRYGLEVDEKSDLRMMFFINMNLNVEHDEERKYKEWSIRKK